MQESTWGEGIRGWLVKLVGLVGAAVCAYCGIGCLERWHVRDHETRPVPPPEVTRPGRSGTRAYPTLLTCLPTQCNLHSTCGPAGRLG